MGDNFLKRFSKIGYLMASLSAVVFSMTMFYFTLSLTQSLTQLPFSIFNLVGVINFYFLTTLGIRTFFVYKNLIKSMSDNETK